jgi:F0F1-type ATP synthase membrane subunit b/b'
VSRPTKRIVARRRLVLAAFVVAILALTTALAVAQEHGVGGAGAQSGEHRTAPNETAEVGEHAEHGEHAEGGHHGPAPINWTNIWDKKRPAFVALVINFGVLLTLYYMLGKKPVAAALKQRRVTIGKDIDEAQALLAEAKERAKKYQAELNSAETDASTARAGLISAGKGEVDRLLLEAQERADRMKRDADRLVEQERKQVQLDLLKETVDLAVREAAHILEKSVTADDHARLAQDLLLELARRPGAIPGDGARSSVRPGGGGAT